MDSNLSPLCRVTSRNVSSVSLISCVNLIVGWIWLMFDMYFFLKSSVVTGYGPYDEDIVYESLPVWINSDARLVVSNLPMNRQGPFWSPWLFLVFVDKIFRQIRTHVLVQDSLVHQYVCIGLLWVSISFWISF